MSFEGASRPNYGLLVARFSGSGQWDRTLETARDWLAAEPENIQAHMSAGQALINLERYPEAAPHMERVLAGQPSNATAHRLMSILCFHQKQFGRADEAVQKAISLAPNDFRNWYHTAWMFYANGDRVSARRYAEKARELSPRNPSVLNLLALCAPNDPVSAAQRLQQYKEALEVDPQNPDLHNNLGVHYLNVNRDYAAAEQCFRRALFFRPTSKMARKNLFLTIKHRDKLYRALCMPRDGLVRVWNSFVRLRKNNLLLYLALVPFFWFGLRYGLVLLVLWFLLVWPMVKVYEFLTIGDLEADAGQIGSRRGGFLGYRQWPVWVRLSIFTVCLVSFWSMIAWMVYSWVSASADNPPSTVFMLVMAAMVIGAVGLVLRRLRTKMKQSEARDRARARARRLDGMLNSGNTR